MFSWQGVVVARRSDRLAAKIGKAGGWADRGTWHGHAAGMRWQQAAASPPRAFLEDLRGVDARIRNTCKKLATAIAATGTSLTTLFGAGPGFADRTTSPRTTATRRSRSPPTSLNGPAAPEWAICTRPRTPLTPLRTAPSRR